MDETAMVESLNKYRHSGKGRNPYFFRLRVFETWFPAFAGMTV
jgi:hypothetical protein